MGQHDKNNKNNQTPASKPLKSKQELRQQVQQKETQKQQNGSGSSKDEIIASLRQEMKEMQERLEAVEAMVAVTAKVNTELAKEVDRLEQYGRRHSIVIRGIPPKEEESNDQLKESVKKAIGELGLKEEFNRDFDKTHRIGPVLTTQHGKRQDVIVRFKSHATRYNVYRKRKELKTKTLRITPSLTKSRRKLLSTARAEFESHEDVNFIFVNEHGDTKVRFHEKFKGKYVYDFSSIEELRKLMETPFGNYEDENSDA